MKIFISWSGERSRQVAELLNKWIQCVLQAVDPWLSTRDIDRGAVWFSEITNQLSVTHNGIVCLTKYNLNKPWILFEAGALAKGLSSNRVYTLLIDLTSTDVKDPLAQFNHTTPTKSGIYQLVRTINAGLDLQALKEEILENVFETYWPQFEAEFKMIIDTTSAEEVVVERPQEDMLTEILSSVRGIDKRLRYVENTESFTSSPESISSVKNSNPDNVKFLTKHMPTSRRSTIKTILHLLKVDSVEELLKFELETFDSYRRLHPSIQEDIRSIVEELKRS
jgi:hypothetical protein